VVDAGRRLFTRPNKYELLVEEFQYRLRLLRLRQQDRQLQQTLAGVRTTVVKRIALIRDIRTTAQIVADETRIGHVHVKVAGYIDRVYVNYVGQLVNKGEPLFTLYSPELVSTEEEYLIAKRGDATLSSAPFKEIAQGAQSLLESTRQRKKL